MEEQQPVSEVMLYRSILIKAMLSLLLYHKQRDNWDQCTLVIRTILQVKMDFDTMVARPVTALLIGGGVVQLGRDLNKLAAIYIKDYIGIITRNICIFHAHHLRFFVEKPNKNQ